MLCTVCTEIIRSLLCRLGRQYWLVPNLTTDDEIGISCHLPNLKYEIPDYAVFRFDGAKLFFKIPHSVVLILVARSFSRSRLPSFPFWRYELYMIPTSVALKSRRRIFLWRIFRNRLIIEARGWALSRFYIQEKRKTFIIWRSNSMTWKSLNRPVFPKVKLKSLGISRLWLRCF